MVPYRRGGDLYVCVTWGDSLGLEAGLDLPEDTRDLHVVWQYCNGREHPLIDALKEQLASR